MSQVDLVHKLLDEGVLKTPRIIAAFKKIDRADFVVDEYKGEAYGDYPLPIGYGQTISQPSTVALMLELLQPAEGDKVLDVGSGSGWTTALLAQIVGPKGKIFGLELVPELVKFGRENIARYNFPWAEIEQAREVIGKPEETPVNSAKSNVAMPICPKVGSGNPSSPSRSRKAFVPASFGSKMLPEITGRPSG